jgi:predicted MFS family arabinose efflux permease
MPPTDFDQPHAAKPGMTPARTALFALAAGLAVGNLYLAQPLIRVIAQAFGVPSAGAGMLVTATQVGYALGIFLVVPLGDVLDRRKLIPGILCGAAGMLLGAAMAPTYATLLAALAGVGLTTVSAQLLAPLASELAEPGQRGRVVGTISAGGLTGILLSRTVSGIAADLLGWRAIYTGAAVAALMLAIVLRRVLPPLARRRHIPYPRLLASVFTTVRQHPAVAPTLAICATNFAVFSLFWTALTYLLSASPFSYDTGRIGLFGFAGLAGALGARRAGGLNDRGWSVPASGAAFLLLALALVTGWASRTSLAGLFVAGVLLDLAVQANLVLGQTRLMALAGDARSRVNTALVVSSFCGGAAGSLIAGPLWAAGGWTAITAGALSIAALGFLVWLASRRNRLAVAG